MILQSHSALQNDYLTQPQALNTWCCSLCNKPLRPFMNEFVKALPSCAFSFPIHFSLDSLWIWNLPRASNESLKGPQVRNFSPFPKTWNFLSNLCILKSWNWDIPSPVFYSCNIARSDIFSTLNSYFRSFVTVTFLVCINLNFDSHIFPTGICTISWEEWIEKNNLL